MATGDKWLANKAFYDGLSLSQDGDETEAYGATRYELNRHFSEYERFWKYHVAPATQRPQSKMDFNPGVDLSIIRLAQSSYTVFAYLVEAYDYLALVKNGDFGPRRSFRHWYNTVIYAGNALQVFGSNGLQDAIEKHLAGTMRASIKFWDASWSGTHGTINEVNNYRNYVTHSGKFQVFVKSSGVPYTLKRSEVIKGNEIGWSHSTQDFETNQHWYAPLADVGGELLVATTQWLNTAYKAINGTLASYPSRPVYQSLWGWADEKWSSPIRASRPIAPYTPFQAIAPTVASESVAASGVHDIPPIHMTGSTAPPSIESVRRLK